MDRFVVTTFFVAVLAFLLIPPPAWAALRPATEMILPSVAHAPGRLPGSEFRTDLWLHNPGESSAAVEVAFFHRNLSQPAPAPVILAVAAGEVLAVEDAVLSLFNLPNAVGGLRFLATHPVTVTARVYDVGVAASYGPHSSGTSGQFDAATALEDAVSAGSFADIIGIRGVTEGDFPLWRTNVAFMNGSAGQTQIRLTLFDEGGEEAAPSALFTLRAWEPKQLNDVFAALGGQAAPNGRVRVEVLSGGPVVALGSLLDGRTNDPSTIAMGHGPLRDGTYAAVLDKPTYATPLVVELTQGALVSVAATLLVTAEDVGGGCQGGELARLAGELPVPVVPDDQGRFVFAASATLDGVSFLLELNLAVSPAGGLSGAAVTTVSGSGGCDGTASWPVFGARIP